MTDSEARSKEVFAAIEQTRKAVAEIVLPEAKQLEILKLIATFGAPSHLACLQLVDPLGGSVGGVRYPADWDKKTRGYEIPPGAYHRMHRILNQCGDTWLATWDTPAFQSMAVPDGIWLNDPSHEPGFLGTRLDYQLVCNLPLRSDGYRVQVCCYRHFPTSQGAYWDVELKLVDYICRMFEKDLSEVKPVDAPPIYPHWYSIRVSRDYLQLSGGEAYSLVRRYYGVLTPATEFEYNCPPNLSEDHLKAFNESKSRMQGGIRPLSKKEQMEILLEETLVREMITGDLMYHPAGIPRAKLPVREFTIRKKFRGRCLEGKASVSLEDSLSSDIFLTESAGSYEKAVRVVNECHKLGEGTPVLKACLEIISDSNTCDEVIKKAGLTSYSKSVQVKYLNRALTITGGKIEGMDDLKKAADAAKKAKSKTKKSGESDS